jgi:uncharacterized membrane protein YhaH (DUF805 family)
MTIDNPYAAPGAVVSDVVGSGDEGFAPLAMFSPKARIGRMRYVAYLMGSYLVFGVAIGLLGFVGLGLGTSDRATGVLAMVVLGVAYLAYLVYFGIITVKRSHDMAWSGWMSLLVLIPFVGLIWLFKSGTPGRNVYGLPAPPNTLGVKILAWLLPAFVLIGILAAIALPAYQDYTKRAAVRTGSVR